MPSKNDNFANNPALGQYSYAYNNEEIMTTPYIEAAKLEEKEYHQEETTDLVHQIHERLQCKQDVTVEFISMALDLARLFDKKQSDYGPGNISAFGTFGVLVRMSDKFERLKNLSKAKLDPQNESIVDTYRDIANYAIIALMLEYGFWPK